MVYILKFILGRSGSGKTDYIRKILKDKIKSGNDKIIYIVPEQNSFETEKSLLSFLGERVFKFINVLTFDRINDFVFRKVGGNFSDKLTDGGRNIFMSIAIEKAAPELMLYKKSADNIEMVGMMVNTLKELKMCSLSYEYIEKACDNLEGGTLKQKLKEITTVLKFYQELTEEKFADPFDALTLLLYTLKETRLLRGYTVFVDSFHSFTIQRLNLLEEIIFQAKDTFITFCTDGKFNSTKEPELFSNVNRVLNKISIDARKNGIDVGKYTLLSGTKRFQFEDLKCLERNIFTTPKQIFESEPENIFLYNASDIYDECEFIARTIRKKIIVDGYRYRDFTVVTRNIDKYLEKIENIFSKYEIPYFMDSPQKIENRALLCTVFSAFDIAISDFESENIFRYLKTGLAGLSIDETSILENYVFLWGITGDKWKAPFTMSPEGFGHNIKGSDEERLIQIEKMRLKIITPLMKFQQNITKKTGYEISRAVYELLEDVEIPQNIREFCGEFIDAEDISNAEEQSRLWNMLMNALDQTAVTLKDVHINPRRFKELLMLVVQSENISFIPQGMDEVIVSSADKREISEYKTVFIIGATEGEFPATTMQTGIFNDAEKKKLASLGVKLIDDFETMYDKERFITYLALSSAIEKLYVSWPSSTISGETMVPSEIVREIRNIFPKIKVYDKYSIPKDDWLWAEKPAFEICAKDWNENSLISSSLKNYFSQKDEYRYRIRSIKRAINKEKMDFKEPAKAEKLFGKEIKVSASQIEKFYSCRFQYFCQYGLQAKERKKAKFNSLEYGSLVHFVLEKMFNMYQGSQILKLPGQKIKNSIDIIMNEYINSYMGGSENKSSRFKYLFSRCSQAIEFLVKRLIDEFNQSSFLPADCELIISEKGDIKPFKISLPGGGSVVIEGKVDRVDVMELEGKKYIRVIDYKTGSKKFKLSDVIYGLNMQMLFYLAIISKNGESRYGNIVPAGILYMPALKPSIILDNREIPEDLNKKLYREVKMNGLILKDTRVVSGMEEEAKGIFIPVSIKNGALSGEDSLVSLEQMGLIMRYIEYMAIDMAENIHKGKISMNPVENGNKTCEMCPYGAICCFEDDEYLKISNKKDKEKVLNEMKKRLGEKERD